MVQHHALLTRGTDAPRPLSFGSLDTREDAAQKYIPPFTRPGSGTARGDAGSLPEVPQFPIASGPRRRTHRPEQQRSARERREQAPAQRRGSRHRAPFFLSFAWHP